MVTAHIIFISSRWNHWKQPVEVMDPVMETEISVYHKDLH